MAPALTQDEEPVAVVAKTANGVESVDKAEKVEDKAEGKAEDTTTSEAKTDSETTTPDEKKTVVGMECAQKDLYQKWDKQNRFTWTDTYPKDLEEAAENEATEKFAILVRNKKSYDSRKSLEIDSIVIQSPLLKNVLRNVLDDYPGVAPGLQRLVFSAPFQPFVHRWDRLKAALTNTSEYDEATRDHVRLLYDLLHTELKDTIRAVDDYMAQGVVSYEHAWTVFHPGCTIVTSRYGHPVANRLKQGQYIKHARLGPCFELVAERLEYDGHRFGYDTAHVYVLPFVGTVPIATLDAFPLDYHPDPASVRASLLERGQRFAALAGWHYMAYKGTAIEQKENGPARIAIDSRIVVDAQTHARFNADYATSLAHLTKTNNAVRKAQVETADDEFNDPGTDNGMDDGQNLRMRIINGRVIYDFGDGSDGEAMLKFKKEGAEGEDEDESEAASAHRQAAALTEDQLLLASPMVKGYCLRTKKWLEFYVDSVRPIQFNEQAFDRLVLPAGHKQLVLAFTQSQIKNKHKFDDVIAGKGKGIIMLLSGGPGIGKTLTAESVAESMRVPLFVMSGGDLGMTSNEVEFNLGRVLDMVAKWNAVLLIDECDVFLEARTAADLDRNRIVSIFLRTLEYYEGILFLTTNRVNQIDEAFHSRIHISLAYPRLDAAARRQVWEGFLGENGKMGHGAEAAPTEGTAKPAEEEKVKPKPKVHMVTADDITRLSELDLNGRQIKNFVKTSHLLAFQLGQTLSFEHLQTVLQIEGHAI
ncbi:hypothetical protein Sste5346_008414 [Sporothrix stenoceras]|uniref:AAA+ ATPase domain-containing protein n=1 Tax=Sporothrix stenoceras TaxID=5173 RepID=A0ABR3YQH2_9PEZI